MLAQGHPQLQVIPKVKFKGIIDRSQHLIHQIADLLANDQIPLCILAPSDIGDHFLSFQMDGYVYDLAGGKFHPKLILDLSQYLLCHAISLSVPHLLSITFRHRYIMSPSHPQNSDLNMKDQILKRHIGYVKIIFGQTAPHALIDPLDLLRHILVPVQFLQQPYLLRHIPRNTQPAVKLLALHPDPIVRFPFQAQVVFSQKALHLLQVIGQSFLGNVKEFA